MNIDEIISKLTPEQIEKARSLKTADELAEFFESDGIELSDEQLSAVNGGYVWECSNAFSGGATGA